jgi:type I restriction enzyme, R subunit
MGPFKFSKTWVADSRKCGSIEGANQHTGFDTPILQAMYLDKPLRDDTLLQAICRVNRTYSGQKTHGMIVDYLGIFDDVAKALEFDEKGITAVVSNIQELLGAISGGDAEVPKPSSLAWIAPWEGYEGLIAAQQCLPNNSVRDNFAAEYSLLGKLWEAISPDPILGQDEKDYRWLSQAYQSVQRSSGHGKLIWHSLGAKTIELIHQNVHVDTVRDDLDTLVLDADLLEAVLSNPDPKMAKEIEIIWRGVCASISAVRNSKRYRNGWMHCGIGSSLAY